jgi:hypothetical protein
MQRFNASWGLQLRHRPFRIEQFVHHADMLLNPMFGVYCLLYQLKHGILPMTGAQLLQVLVPPLPLAGQQVIEDDP